MQAVAYRMLGSTSEANDAVQESWLRLGRTDATAIDNLGGWLTTVVGRVCLNRLRSRRTHREEPLSVHVPDLIVTRHDDIDPEQSAVLADSVGVALLVVLETLEPAERLAFVLHDLFAVPFDQIAPLIGRSPVAAASWPAGPSPSAGDRTGTRHRSRTPTQRGRCLLRRSPQR